MTNQQLFDQIESNLAELESRGCFVIATFIVDGLYPDEFGCTTDSVTEKILAGQISLIEK